MALPRSLFFMFHVNINLQLPPAFPFLWMLIEIPLDSLLICTSEPCSSLVFLEALAPFLRACAFPIFALVLPCSTLLSFRLGFVEFLSTRRDANRVSRLFWFLFPLPCLL